MFTSSIYIYIISQSNLRMQLCTAQRATLHSSLNTTAGTVTGGQTLSHIFFENGDRLSVPSSHIPAAFPTLSTSPQPHSNHIRPKQTNHVWRSQTYHIRRSRIYHNRIKANLRGQPVAEIPSEVRSTETSELSCGQSRRLRLRMKYHVAQQHIILLRSKR